MPLDRPWLSFRKPQSSPHKNEPFCQEMHLKIPLSSWGLKLPNSKPGCIVAAPLLCEIVTTNGFLTSISFRYVFFQLLIPGLTTFSALESKSWFEIFTHSRTPEIYHLNDYSLCSKQGSFEDPLFLLIHKMPLYTSLMHCTIFKLHKKSKDGIGRMNFNAWWRGKSNI